MRFRQLRLTQIRLTSALLRQLTRERHLASIVRRLDKWSLTRQAVNVVAGYNRVFPDLSTAQKIVEQYGMPSHESVANIYALQDLMTATRPSDYPVLFHISRFTRDGLRVFDLGGMMGDLFYLYDRYLGFPQSLRWTVHDLPNQMELGRALACKEASRDSNSAMTLTGHPVMTCFLSLGQCTISVFR